MTPWEILLNLEVLTLRSLGSVFGHDGAWPSSAGGTCSLTFAGAAFALVVLAVSGCVHRVVRSRLALPEAHTVVRDQLVVHSDFPLPAHHRLLEELAARRVDLSQDLMLPISDEPIHVYLFDSSEELATFVRLHHPRLPGRRAYFLETDTRLAVYAQWGDRVAEDLRHEVTHGYLHSVVPNLPLWLDEGLAEYYEVSRGQAGLNRGHLENVLGRLADGRWRPDLARLEALPPDADMTQDDYAESWAWAHFLLQSGPERRDLLREHLRQRRLGGSAAPLSAALGRQTASVDDALVEHLRRLRAE